MWSILAMSKKPNLNKLRWWVNEASLGRPVHPEFFGGVLRVCDMVESLEEGCICKKQKECGNLKKRR